MRSAWLAGLSALLVLSSACGDDHAPPAGAVLRGARASELDGGDGGMASDGGAAGGSGSAGRDGGRKPFGFDGFGVDASAPPLPQAGAGAGPDAAGEGAGPDAGPALPEGWRCAPQSARDEVCDCGCGAPDPACEALGCSDPGCAAAACEVCFSVTGEARDCGAAGEWQCEAERREDFVCDCGCGALDPDCGEQQGCHQLGCNVSGCEVCQTASGEADCGAPAAFTCGDDALHNGKCDCGCGNYDPECGGASACIEPGCAAAGCESCHGSDGGERECDGDPIGPEPSSCDESALQDERCDCGCGTPDPMCTAGCTEAGCHAPGCDRCVRDDGDEAPCDWTCDPALFDNGQCDCGCGALDPDCGNLGCDKPGCVADACVHCFEPDGESIECHRSACTAGFQNDGVCDCGCREDDIDCAAVSDCIAPGCSASGCGRCHDATGLVVACEDFACSEGLQGGGDDCNCGCGAPDPDCGVDGCAVPGCRANACETCRGTNGAPMSCAP
jgi:hypothetical protein